MSILQKNKEATWWQEDHSAVDRARRLWDTLALGIPVDVHQVCASVGIDVEQVTGEPTFRAVLFHESDLIKVNKRLSKTQQRYAIGHEIGHCFVRRGEIEVRPKRAERICQLFAANLLMPPDIVRHVAEHYHGKADMVGHIMRHFSVSREAACIQLRRLRVIPGDDKRCAMTAEEHEAGRRQFDQHIADDLRGGASPWIQVPLYDVDVDAVYRSEWYKRRFDVR